VGSGGLAAQVFTVLTIPIITRLYSPESYAGWALLMSVAVIFTSVAVLRYELAVVLPDTHEEAVNVIAVCVLLSVIIAGVAAILLPFCGQWLIGKNFQGELNLWLWTIPPFILAAGIYQAALSWCTRTEEFVWYSLLQLALPFLTILSQIILALLGFRTAGGLIIGTIIGQFASAILIGFLTYRKYGGLIAESVHGKEIRDAFIRYRNYPLYMTPYTLIGTLRDRLIYFLLANFSGKVLLGYYSLSARMVNLPNSLVSSAIRPVFFQKAASSDFQSLEAPINRILRLLAIVVVPFWIIFLFHATTLFALIFGEAWREAGLYAAILSVPAIPLLLGNWLDRAFDALGKQRLAFILELIFSLASVVILTVAMIIFENALLAVILQSVVMTIYYAYWLYALFTAAGFNPRGLWQLVGTVFFAVLLSTTIALLITLMFSGLYAVILNTIAVGFVVIFYCLRQRESLKFI
jgi:Membrane protein involved in the export of O-antigen and teichoic acid